MTTFVISHQIRPYRFSSCLPAAAYSHLGVITTSHETPQSGVTAQWRQTPLDGRATGLDAGAGDSNSAALTFTGQMKLGGEALQCNS